MKMICLLAAASLVLAGCEKKDEPVAETKPSSPSVVNTPPTGGEPTFVNSNESATQPNH